MRYEHDTLQKRKDRAQRRIDRAIETRDWAIKRAERYQKALDGLNKL